ncbi:MAG: hypothetical protein RLZZ231_450 [Bacteroidota bacterium]|jgi:hypothetical protein
MKIHYQKKRLHTSLLLGVLWLTISTIGIFTKENRSWTDFGFFLISILYFGMYFYEKKNQYLTLDAHFLSLNQPFGKKIELSELIQIKKFAGDYILKTAKTELRINTQIIDSKSLSELDAELNKLNVEWV